MTVDHVVPLAAGGAPFDIGNTAVLCRSCNSTKGASTEGGGVAPLALLEKVAVARPTGVGRGITTYEIPIEGRDEWLAAARRPA